MCVMVMILYYCSEMLLGGSALPTAGESVDRVSGLVNAAARDITFYMQKAPLFDFTLLNAG